MSSKNSHLNKIFNGIKQRCYNVNYNRYNDYGGRGIKLCPEWNNRELVPHNKNTTKGFLAFKEWALNNGFSDHLTIDRIDVNKDYSPDNCRWITYKEQANNRRNNRCITYNGKTQTIAQWAEELNMNPRKLRSRLRYGWSIEKAFNTI